MAGNVSQMAVGLNAEISHMRLMKDRLQKDAEILREQTKKAQDKSLENIEEKDRYVSICTEEQSKLDGVVKNWSSTKAQLSQVKKLHSSCTIQGKEVKKMLDSSSKATCFSPVFESTKHELVSKAKMVAAKMASLQSANRAFKESFAVKEMERQHLLQTKEQSKISAISLDATILELCRKLEELKKALKEKKERLRCVQDSKRKFDDEKSRLTTESSLANEYFSRNLAAKSEEILKLKGALQSSIQNFEQNERAIEDLKHTIITGRELLSGLDASTEKGKREFDPKNFSLEAKRNELVESSRALDIELATKISLRNSLLAKKENENMKNLAIIALLEVLRADYVLLCKQNDALNIEVSEAEELLQRMSDQQLKASDEGTSKILQIKKSIDAHIKEFMHEEAIIVQLEKNNNELETAIQTVESNIKDKVGELDELTTLSEDLDAQHNSYLAAIANEMSESETKLAEIKNTIEEKRLEVEKLTKNISNSKGEIETLKAVFLETLYKKLLHSEIEKTAAKRIDDNEQALKALNRKFEEVNAKSQSETEDLKRDYKKKIEAKKLEAESKLRHRQKIDEELKVSKGLLEKEFPWYSDYNLKLAEAELRAKKAAKRLEDARNAKIDKKKALEKES